jgi:large subunit ribosomal protein L24
MTTQPHKQRNQTRDARLHERHTQVHSTLSEELREEFDTRRVRVNAGDTVEVMRGDHAGEEAEVVDVDLRDATVSVEDVTQETADGEEVPRQLDASNLRVVELNREDDRRMARLEGDDE